MARLITAALLAAAVAACSSTRATPASPAAAAGTELPEGRGKQMLMASCTSCHDLREVTKFRGYYSRAQWRDVVVTMVEYGADLKDDEVEALADYLDEHLGRRLPERPGGVP